MKSLGLVLLFAAVALSVPESRAQTPRAESSAVAAARDTLRRLEARSDASGERTLLLTLRAQLEKVHSLPDVQTAPEVRKLEEAERKLWQALPNNSSQPLPPGTHEELKIVRTAFEAAFPEPSASRGAAVVRAPSRSVEVEEARVSARVASAHARTTGAIADPNRFFDGHVATSGAGTGPGKAGPASSVHSTPNVSYKLTTVVPASDLRHAPIPSPAAVAREEKGFFGRAYDNVKSFTVTTVLPAAKTGATIALLMNPSTAPLVLVPAAMAVAQAYHRDNTLSPANIAGCTRAVQGTPYFASEVAGVCRSSPAIAPILSGLLDSVKQQFGTVAGLITTVVSLVLGILIGALTGGIGLIIKALVAIGMTLYAATNLALGLKAAMDEYAASKDGSPERYAAIRKIGVVGGGLLLMGVLALLGVGAGKLAAGTRAGAAANAAASGLVQKLGIEGLMASVESKIPWLAKLAPAAETEKAPPTAPRSVPGNRSKISAPEPPTEPAPEVQTKTVTAVRESPPNPYKAGEVSKATEWRQWAEKQGWKFSQTENGPIKYTDENGTLRLQIKRGSARAPGSENPHIELRDGSGRYIDPRNGNAVNRRTPENHMQIDWDLP